MQVKYLSALKTKYASFGLSKEALDRVASQRVKTIANEDEIDNDVASSEVALLIMKEMQGAADALRSNNVKIQKELDNLKNNPNPVPQPPNEPKDNPFDAEFKAMKEWFAEVKAERDAEKKKAQNDSVIADVHEVLKQKGCTNDFIRNCTLNGAVVGESDTVESLAEKYKAIYDENCKAAFGDGYVPPMGNNRGGGEPDYAAMVKNLQEGGLLPKSNQ